MDRRLYVSRVDISYHLTVNCQTSSLQTLLLYLYMHPRCQVEKPYINQWLRCILALSHIPRTWQNCQNVTIALDKMRTYRCNLLIYKGIFNLAWFIKTWQFCQMLTIDRKASRSPVELRSITPMPSYCFPEIVEIRLLIHRLIHNVNKLWINCG